jgi:MFS family permease
LTDPFEATEAVAEPAPHGPRAFRSLSNRDFRTFWIAALISNTGTWMQTITVPAVIYDLTHHSNFWLGFAAFVGFFPSLMIGPVSGRLADRFSRRTVLLVTQTIQMILAFSLWAFWVAGIATPLNILVHLLIYGVTVGINITSWQSFVPQLVSREDMPDAVRLNSLQFTAGRAFGPALAGLVLKFFGPGTAYMANTVSFVLVLLALLSVRPHEVGASARQEADTRFREGIAYVLARTALWLPVATITIVSLLGTSLLQLAPAYATKQFHVDRGAYGILVAMFGGGALVAAFVMSIIGDRVRGSRTAIAGLVLMSSGVVLLGLTTSYRVGLLAMFLMGFGYVHVTVSLNTSVQMRVAESYRGRVMAIYLMGLLAGVPVGALVLGAVTDAAGLRPATLVCGLTLFAITALAVVRFRGLAPVDEAIVDDASVATG